MLVKLAWQRHIGWCESGGHACLKCNVPVLKPLEKKEKNLITPFELTRRRYPIYLPRIKTDLRSNKTHTRFQPAASESYIYLALAVENAVRLRHNTSNRSKKRKRHSRRRSTTTRKKRDTAAGRVKRRL